MAQWHIHHATRSGESQETVEEELGEGGPKPTHRLAPAVRQDTKNRLWRPKEEEKAIDIEAELRTKPCIEKKEEKKKRRKKKKRKERKRAKRKRGKARNKWGEGRKSVTGPKRFGASGP